MICGIILSNTNHKYKPDLLKIFERLFIIPFIHNCEIHLFSNIVDTLIYKNCHTIKEINDFKYFDIVLVLGDFNFELPKNSLLYYFPSNNNLNIKLLNDSNLIISELSFDKPTYKWDEKRDFYEQLIQLFQNGLSESYFDEKYNELIDFVLKINEENKDDLYKNCLPILNKIAKEDFTKLNHKFRNSYFILRSVNHLDHKSLINYHCNFKTIEIMLTFIEDKIIPNQGLYLIASWLSANRHSINIKSMQEHSKFFVQLFNTIKTHNLSIADDLDFIVNNLVSNKDFNIKYTPIHYQFNADCGSNEWFLNNMKYQYVNPNISKELKKNLNGIENLYKLYNIKTTDKEIQDIANEHLNYIENIEIEKFTDNSKQNQKFKIGFLTNDVMRHPVGKQIFSIIKYLKNKKEIEIVIFNNDKQNKDDIYNKIKETSVNIVELYEKSTKESIKTIRSTNLNVLIDMTGFTRGTRLELLKYRTAPIQLGYFAFPSTYPKGLLDYRISHKDLEEKQDYNFLNEKILFLPNVLSSIDQELINEECKPELTENPSILIANNPKKFSSVFKYLVGRIMKQNPKATITFAYSYFQNRIEREKIIHWLDDHNISASRINFELLRGEKYLDLYRRHWISLDPFPYNGGYTSMECLLMGCPLVTIEGNNYRSRVTTHLNKVIGLDGNIVDTEDKYVKRAIVYLNKPKEFIEQVHEQVAKMTRSSPIGNPNILANDLVALCKDIYKQRIGPIAEKHVKFEDENKVEILKEGDIMITLEDNEIITNELKQENNKKPDENIKEIITNKQKLKEKSLEDLILNIQFTED